MKSSGDYAGYSRLAVDERQCTMRDKGVWKPSLESRENRDETTDLFERCHMRSYRVSTGRDEMEERGRVSLRSGK